MDKTNSHVERITSRYEENYIRSLDDDAQKDWIQGIVERMCEAYGITGKSVKTQLTERLHLNEGTPKSWVYNKRVPFHSMVTCSRETGVSIDWLLDGKLPVIKLEDDVKADIREKLIEHLFNAGRYKLVDTAEGIEITADSILKDVSDLLNTNIQIEEVHKKVG